MRAIAPGLFLVCLLVPNAAAAQSSGGRFRLEAGAGVVINDRGNTVSGTFAFAPVSRLELAVNVERIHIPFEREDFDDGFSVSRGGTLTFASGEVRFMPLPNARVSPFVLAGGGIGQSRPTVNESFPDPVTNDFRLAYAGGGVRVPFGRGLSVSADARAMLGLERDTVMLIIPVRAGIAWSF